MELLIENVVVEVKLLNSASQMVDWVGLREIVEFRQC
jgi:hypothetical protein